MEKRTKDWPPPPVEDRVPTKYGWVVLHTAGFKNGIGTDIGFGTPIQAQAGVEIGDRAEIGPGCRILSVSTISESGEPVFGKVVIGEDAQVGANCVIMPGVTIGKGAIVGALSFVKTDIPAGYVAFGIPAEAKWKVGEKPSK